MKEIEGFKVTQGSHSLTFEQDEFGNMHLSSEYSSGKRLLMVFDEEDMLNLALGAARVAGEMRGSS